MERDKRPEGSYKDALDREINDFLLDWKSGIWGNVKILNTLSQIAKTAGAGFTLVINGYSLKSNWDFSRLAGYRKSGTREVLIFEFPNRAERKLSHSKGIFPFFLNESLELMSLKGCEASFKKKDVESLRLR